MHHRGRYVRQDYSSCSDSDSGIQLNSSSDSSCYYANSYYNRRKTDCDLRHDFYRAKYLYADIKLIGNWFIR
jgi:hypothetical protein